MVALDIRSRNAITEVLDAVVRRSDHEAGDLVSRLYAEHVHNLFNYGMNACDDQALVKNCIVQLFLLIGDRSDLLREAASADSRLFKTFRRLLMQKIVTSRTGIEIFFSIETQMTQGLTSLQREALFLKFQRRLSYREVATVMDITIEQLRSQISKAVDVLLHRNKQTPTGLR